MRSVGNIGEEHAVACLAAAGYTVICRNFSTRFGEIDIIAQKDDILAFIEVKSRAKRSFGSPAEAVTHTKQRKLILSAEIFLAQFPCDLQPRFDIFEVIFQSPREHRVISTHHIMGAFEVTEENHN